MRRFFLFLFAGSCIAFPFFASAQNLTSAVANRQQELKSQLEIIEGQIAAQEQLLNVAQNQRQTLQTQVDAFNAEIKRTQLQVQAITLTIAQLNDNIGAHNETLSRLSARLAAEKESLAQILRQTQMLDVYSAVSVALGSQNVF